MRIVKIIGGLGNQMFQYAFAVALKQHFPNEEIVLDCTYMNNYRRHNGLELDTVFDINLRQASFLQLMKVTRPVKYHKLSRAVRILLPNLKTEYIETSSNVYSLDVFKEHYHYYEGYWQNPLYFDKYKGTLLQDFQFDITSLNDKSRDLLEKLSCDDNSVSIHIRRGDYLKSKVYEGCADLNYYKQAASHMLSKVDHPTFYVFSDDIKWCKDNVPYFLGTHNTHYIDWNKDADSWQDMLLISRCKHNIIANSSFSWWAAYLNKNASQVVCCPRKWNNLYHPNTVQCKSWIQL